VQETLTNVLRHAGVKQAQLMIWISEPGHFLTIQVEDHGAGFDAAAVSHVKSSGLSGMRERAMLLGGNFRIQSACGEGTCVTAELPLQPQKSEGAL
jgi:signal transduction histidine kinase